MPSGRMKHPLGICPTVVYLYLEVDWFPASWGTATLISKVDVQVCTPISNVISKYLVLTNMYFSSLAKVNIYPSLSTVSLHELKPQMAGHLGQLWWSVVIVSSTQSRITWTEHLNDLWAFLQETVFSVLMEAERLFILGGTISRLHRRAGVRMSRQPNIHFLLAPDWMWLVG